MVNIFGLNHLPASLRSSAGRLLLPVILLVALLLTASGAAAQAFTVTIDRSVLEIGEEATLSMQFQNMTPQQAPDVSQIGGFSVSYSGQSGSTQVINNQVSRTTTLTYQLIANKAGDLVFPSLTVQANGKNYSSRPVPVKVVNVGQKAKITGQAEDAFIKITLPNPEVFVGELFPVEVHLYALEGQLGPDPELQTEGFTFGPKIKGAGNRETVNGRSYNHIGYSTSATAARTGTLSLGPAKLVFGLPDRQRVDIFGRPGLRQVTLVSEPATLRVLPLPEANRPASFNGSVGSFTLSVNAGPTNLNVGDPITVRVTLTGFGSLDSANLPEQAAWREFKVYPPTSKVTLSDQLGLSGGKTFEQVIAPQNADIKELAPVVFSFFDSKQRQYRTLTGPVIPLIVRPAAATPQPTIFLSAPANAQPSAAQGIVHIKQEPGLLSVIQPPLMQRPWFLLINALAPAAWLVAWIRRRRIESLANNPRRRRRLEVTRLVRDGLNDLRTHAASGKSDEFFATVFRLLQEQIGERLDLAGASITEDVLDQGLSSGGLAAESRQLLHSLFQACNQARYAPVQSSQELASFIPKVEQALADLQKLPASAGGIR